MTALLLFAFATALAITPQPGDYVTFGTYPQTASGTSSTPIEWLVLDVKGDQALLLSRYGLDAIPYNRELVEIT